MARAFSLGPMSLEPGTLALFLTSSLISFFLSHVHPVCPSCMHYSSLPVAYPPQRVLGASKAGQKDLRARRPRTGWSPRQEGKEGKKLGTKGFDPQHQGPGDRGKVWNETGLGLAQPLIPTWPPLTIYSWESFPFLELTFLVRGWDMGTP